MKKTLLERQDVFVQCLEFSVLSLLFWRYCYVVVKCYEIHSII